MISAVAGVINEVVYKCKADGMAQLTLHVQVCMFAHDPRSQCVQTRYMCARVSGFGVWSDCLVDWLVDIYVHVYFYVVTNDEENYCIKV